MKSFRVWVLGALTLASAGWLQADTVTPADPKITLKEGGGGGSIDIGTNPGDDCTVGLFGSLTCTSTSELLGAYGSTVSIKNDSTTQTITALNIFLATTNFDQTFTSSAVIGNTQAADFQDSLVTVQPFENIPGLCSALTGGIISTTCVEVSFFSGVSNNTANPCSIGNPTNPCTVPPDSEDVAEGTGGATPFVGGSQVVVQAFFNTPTNGFLSLPAGSDSALVVTPEPSMLCGSLIALIGLIVARRRLRKT